MTFLFDGGPPQFSPADIEPLQGDGERVRSAGRMLHDAAGALDFAQRAAGQLQTLTDGVSWQGNAFQAFKGGLEKQPLPQHLVNARNVLGWTGDELTRLATKLDDIQADVARLRQRADLLGVAGDVPEERRAEVDAIKREYEDLKERREQALDAAGHVFDEMTDKTVFAKPPPSGWGRLKKAAGGAIHFTKEFAVGLGQGVVDIGKGLGMIVSLATPMGMAKAVTWVKENRHLISQAITYAMHDPIGMATNVGKVLIDYDTLRQSPGRWLGKLAPQIAIAVATAGAGGLASRSAAIAKNANAGADLGRLAKLSEDSKTVTGVFEKYVQVGRWGDTATLSTSQAFRKGVVDTFVNKPLREAASAGVYGRVSRAQYLVHDRKFVPLWGKLTKKVPVVTAVGAQVAAEQGLVENISNVVEDGAARAEEARRG
jgi:hypothetical protein